MLHFTMYAQKFNSYISNKARVMLTLLNLNQAFDCMDRRKRLGKLELVGIGGNTYSWV